MTTFSAKTIVVVLGAAMLAAAPVMAKPAAKPRPGQTFQGYGNGWGNGAYNGLGRNGKLPHGPTNGHKTDDHALRIIGIELPVAR